MCKGYTTGICIASTSQILAGYNDQMTCIFVILLDNPVLSISNLADFLIKGRKA